MVKKNMNVMGEKAHLLDDLPFTRDFSSAKTSRDVLVLKEDLAGLYDTSWELFVQGTSARKTEMSDSPHPPLVFVFLLLAVCLLLAAYH
jgi:hypothetical protein